MNFRSLLNWLTLIALVGVTAYLATHLGRVGVEAGTSVLLNENDRELAYYYNSRSQWGYDELAIVCATRQDWISREGVTLLKQLVAELQALPRVQRVFSILDLPLLRQKPGGGLAFEVSRLGGKGIDLARAREEVLGHTHATGNLISADGRDLAILVYLDVPPASADLDRRWSRLQARRFTDPGAVGEIESIRSARLKISALLKQRRIEMMYGLRELTSRWRGRLSEPIRLSGTTTINVNLMEHVEQDIRIFSWATLLLLTLALLLIYRRLRFVLLPVVCCLLPVVMVLGSMGMLGMRLTVITADLPVLLFVLLLPYTIYFIERYRERRVSHPQESADEGTGWAIGAVWWPCVFSCLTTMAGFAALMTSGILPVATFGRLMTAGMGLGLLIVCLALSATSRTLPALTVWAGGKSRPGGLVRLFEWAALSRPGLVILLNGLILALSLWGTSRLRAEVKLTEYFWPSSELYQGLEYIDKRMGGSSSLEIVLTSKQKGFFLTPAGLAAQEAATRYLERLPETGSIRSLKTLSDELAKKNKMLVALLPLMIVSQPQVRPLLRDFANDDFTMVRILVRMRESEASLQRNKILRGLRTDLAQQPALKRLDVRVTGVFVLYANMLSSLIQNQKETFLLVVAAILLMLTLLFRSPVLASLVLMPQVLPALVMLGVMGWSGIPLDLVTVMITSVAMGVGVDAAIQYTLRYRAELEVDGDRRAAVSRTHATTGRAIWISTTVIVAGFCVLMLSRFKPSVWFGLFTAIAMLISQFAALTTLPSIFLLTGIPHSANAGSDSGTSNGGAAEAHGGG